MQIITIVKKPQSITPDHLCSVSLVSHVSTGRYFSMNAFERSAGPQGARTICLCSRLLFYSKCSGFTVCLTYVVNYVYKSMINKR